MRRYQAIGACYLVRQAPGAEQVGGLQVVVRPCEGDEGSIKIIPTDWRTGLDLGDQITTFAEEAVRGVREVAEKYGVPLQNFDIELSAFIYQDVDSYPDSYYQAGKSAFRSALEMWRIRDLSNGLG